jgi:hypothetical protein
MRHCIYLTTTVLAFSLLLHTTAPARLAPERLSIALLSRVILDVNCKIADNDWGRAQRGEMLAAGDRVRTGEKSLAVIKFKDNSLVRVREKSELTVSGDVRGRSFFKSVDIEKGVVGFNIEKQRVDEEFQFTSPTSVASIRGTSGQFTRGEAGDTVTVVEGSVLLTNKLSGQSADVRAGFTGISSTDGTVEVRPATPAERSSAEGSSRPGDRDNRLEFEFRDGQGNQKELKIEYRD